jgi:hypothetical protein
MYYQAHNHNPVVLHARIIQWFMGKPSANTALKPTSLRGTKFYAVNSIKFMPLRLSA